MEGFYKSYDWMIRRVCPGYDSLLNLVAENVPAGVKSFLDLGCGTGTLALKVLERFPGVRYFGIDLQGPLVEAARKKTGGGNATFLVGDIMSVEWPTADCVVSSLALHHLSHEDKAKVFRKIRDSSSSFVYFDRIKGGTPAEDSRNVEHVLGFMRSNGFSEADLKAAIEDLTIKDNPLTRDELKALLSEAGWSWREAYHELGFGVYSCTRKS